MKLRTSYFSFTVLKKDITRFMPLWCGYCVVLFIFWLMATFSKTYSMNILHFEFVVLPCLLLVYAILCAICLFGDLYTPRRCYALHAMPLTREGWFLTHCTSGFLFFLIPTAIFCLSIISTTVSPFYAGIVLLSLCLFYLFYFGIALLCSMLCGNRLGAVFMYGVCSFMGQVLQWVFTTLFAPLLPSVGIDLTAFDALCPVLRFTEFCNTLNSAAYYNQFAALDWRYVVICAGIGIWAALLALILYCRRRLETAGNFTSIRGLDIAFQILFSLMFAVLLFNLIGYFDWEYFLLIPYMALGLFIARMLQMKRLNVFQPSAFIVLGLLVAVLYGGIGLIGADAFNIVGYVPEAEWVESVSIYSTETEQEYDYIYFNSEQGAQLTNPEDISAVTQLHTDLLQKSTHINDDTRIYLTYNLKNGTQICRHYTYRKTRESQLFMNKLINSWQNIFGVTDWKSFLKEVYSISYYANNNELICFFCDPAVCTDIEEAETTILSRNIMEGYLNAWLVDCEAGSVYNVFRPHYVVIRSRGSDGTERTLELRNYDGNNTSGKYIGTYRRKALSYPNQTIGDIPN